MKRRREEEKYGRGSRGKGRDEYTGSCAKKVGMGEGNSLPARPEWVYPACCLADVFIVLARRPKGH